MRYLTGLLAAFCVLSVAAQAQETDDHIIYFGAYYEDPVTNDEDPTFGSIHLVVPRDDGPFSGEMNFTFVGCQSQSSGQVTGAKTQNGLNGLWSGAVDQTEQSGTFTGSVQSDGQITGDYTVDGGKQFNVVDGCIEYYIAPNGTFTLATTPLIDGDQPTKVENELLTVTCTDQISILPKWPTSVYLVSVQIVVPGLTAPTVVTPLQQITYLENIVFTAQDLLEMAERAEVSEWASIYVTVAAVNARSGKREQPIILPASCLPELAALSR